MENKMYNAVITRITNLRPIPKADRLLVGECLHQEVVVGIDTREGQLGIFFGADGRLSDEFLSYNKLVRTVHEDGTKTGSFAANGKVRVQKIRGQKSNGFFCPLKYLEYAGNIDDLNDGEELNTFHGHKFCEKYVVRCNPQSQKKASTDYNKPKFVFFREHKDTPRILYKLDEIEKGMKLVITEKLHGTSQRSAHALESQQTWWGSLINGLCKKTIIKPTLTWKYVAGTHHTVIKDWERHTGYYAEKEGFRKEIHDKYFEGMLHRGETIYYEIVGYTKDDSLIMASGKTEKLQDKELLKRYGKEMKFTYGNAIGGHTPYVYRITMTDEMGIEKDLPWDKMCDRCMELNVWTVPYLTSVESFDGNIDFLVDVCKRMADGASTLDARHIKEGVVVRVDGNEWVAYKYKSFNFDVLEDNQKIDGLPDIEEEDGLEAVQ